MKNFFHPPHNYSSGFSVLKGRESAGFSVLKGRESAGFTIIELLVVFTVISILSGIGIASFVSYSRSQQLNQVSNDVKLLINEAKFNSLNVVRNIQGENGTRLLCEDANSLQGYSVSVIGATRLELRQICTTSGSRLVKSIALPTNISIANSNQPTSCSVVTFGALSASVNGAPCTLSINGFGGEIKTLSIDAIGNIKLE
jgi:prepilin-type N-terminal cleavage/methylation domain-containing protein